jgi:hypothetical protein
MATVLIGLLLSFSASAETTPPSCGEVPIQQLNYVKTAEVDKFDPSLGELKSVTITVKACGYAWRTLKNQDPIPTGVDYHAFLTAIMFSDIPGIGERNFQIGEAFDFHLMPGESYEMLIGSQASPVCDYGEFTIDDPADLAEYIGAGQKVQIPVWTQSGIQASGSTEWSSNGETHMGVKICVTYEYDVPACISGRKINDRTGQGIEGWTINLLKDGAVIDTTQTDSDGYYEFCDLLPGNYRICEEDRDGWMHVDPPCRDITLSGEDVEDVDFHNVPLLCISGHKFNSKTGEGLSGWTIQLKDSTGAVIDTTTTVTGGYYEFCGLAAGDYEVCEVLKPGWKVVGPICIDVTLVNQDSTENNFENEPIIPPCVCPFLIKNDLYTASCNEVKVVDADKGILANDPAGSVVLNPESITIDPKYGTIEVFEDGSFVYDPTVATGRINSGTYVIFKYNANNGYCDSKYPGIAKIQVSCPRR